MSPKIMLSVEDLNRLPVEARDAVLDLFRSEKDSWTEEEEEVTPAAGPQADEEEPVEMSFGQAKRFLAGCSEKSISIMKHVVMQPNPFRYKDLLTALGDSVDDAGGVWGGLTKRTRTITGEKNARLIIWDETMKEDGMVGRMSDVTRNAFRKAFQIP